MKIILTGSSGRIGRAIFGALVPVHEVIGIDRVPFASTRVIGDCGDRELLETVLQKADAVIHCAGPHAPHVGILPDAEFERVNVECTRLIYNIALQAGVSRFLYTSTTALYGHAIEAGQCTWVDEDTMPRPKSIYHRTKLAAEHALEEMACDALPVRVLRMSRCFPEPAPEMALYRLHRGIDARDVGTGHALALGHEGAVFERFILSGATPFTRDDCEGLAQEASAILKQREPELVTECEKRGWPIPAAIDRIYDSSRARKLLGWQPQFGWREVMAQADRQDLEVLPARTRISRKSE